MLLRVFFESVLRGERQNNAFCRLQRKLIQLSQPERSGGVARHAPIAAGRQRDRTDLRAIREAGTFKLLGEETSIEVPEPVKKRLGVVNTVKSTLCNSEHFARLITAADAVEEIKVMQQIGTDKFLCFLCDFFAVRREQFGAYRRIQNILQDSRQTAVGRCIGLVRDQMTDQRFGDRCIDAVHRHVVTVIGGPAERQLAQVPGSDDKAAKRIRKVHQDLCAFPGLGIHRRHYGFQDRARCRGSDTKRRL